MVHFPSVQEGIECAQTLYVIVKSGETEGKTAEIVEHSWNVLGVLGRVTVGDPHFPVGDAAAVTFDAQAPDFLEQVKTQLETIPGVLPQEQLRSVAEAEARDEEKKAIPWLLLGKIALALLQKFLLS